FAGSTAKSRRCRQHPGSAPTTIRSMPIRFLCPWGRRRQHGDNRPTGPPVGGLQREEEMKRRIREAILSMAIAAGFGLGAATAHAEPTGTFKYAEQVKLITMDPQQQSGSG